MITNRGRFGGRCLALALLGAGIFTNAADAASLSPKDVQIIAKAIGFMEPAPSGAATVAIVYNPADHASEQDALAIADFFGHGLKAGNAILKPEPIPASDLDGGAFLAVIPAQGAMSQQLANAARSQHTLCITTDAAAVRAGTCMMAVKSDPSVEITVNKAAATAAHIGFDSAFLMMAHQM